jgi:hypothetical protein
MEMSDPLGDLSLNPLPAVLHPGLVEAAVERPGFAVQALGFQKDGFMR